MGQHSQQRWQAPSPRQSHSFGHYPSLGPWGMRGGLGSTDKPIVLFSQSALSLPKLTSAPEVVCRQLWRGWNENQHFFLQVKKTLIGSQGSKILRLNSFSAKAAISPPPLSCTMKGGFMRICVTMRSWFRWSVVKQQTKLTTYSPVMLLYSEVFVFCFCEIVMSSLRNEG